MDNSQATKVVEQIGQINFEGNILPSNWLRNIETEAGKPDTIGAILLSDIIYWYRPTEVRDEATGLVVGYKKKFKADKLQRSYEQFSGQFGFSKSQVRRAIKRLEEQGLITVELRNITTQTGMKLSNVMFIEPVPQKIKEITHRVDPMDKFVNTYGQICTHPPYKFVHTLPTNLHTPMDKNVQTYTETTTETTTEISTKTTTDNVVILTAKEQEFLEVLAKVPNYPLDREKDLEMYHTLEERYPKLNLIDAIESWRIHKLDKPLKPNASPRAQINNAFRKYVEWGKCLKKKEDADFDYEADYWAAIRG